LRFESEEILETFKMLYVERLEIRAVTMGVSLLDCISGSARETSARIKEKIDQVAGKLVSTVASISDETGVTITNTRIASTPVSLLLARFPNVDSAVEIGLALDDAARDVGVDFVGGFTALVDRGISRSDSALIDSIPVVLSRTSRVNSSVNVASTRAGINVDAVNIVARKIKETAEATSKLEGIGAAKLGVFCNAPPDNPFMAGAFHGIGQGEVTINVAISGPSAIRAAVENSKGDMDELSDRIKRAAFKMTRVGQLIGKETARRLGVKFGIVDVSIAPTTAKGNSVVDVIEAMGVQRCGAPGTTAAMAMLADCIKKGGMMACTRIGGLSGVFIPVSEDSGMNERVGEGSMNLEKLEAITSVSSVGLDMICIPGDTDESVIAGLIADEAAIGVVNDKTTAVRVIPVPGKKSGQKVNFGGLFGEGTVVDVRRWGPSKFLERGGQISGTVRSAKN
jgi:uncharacterized protein (UPF0210 family)